MRREHFAVRINVDAGTRRLLQKHFQIAEIVPGNKDPRIFPHPQLHRRHLRLPVSAGIGSVEKRHAVDAEFSRFQRQRRQRRGVKGIVQELRQGLLNERVDRPAVAAQHVRVLDVRRQPLKPVHRQLTQAAQILVFRPQDADESRLSRVIFAPPFPDGSVGKIRFAELRPKLRLLRQRLRHARRDRFLVKIRVRNRHEKIFRHQPVDCLRHISPRLAQSRRHRAQPLRHIDEQILHGGDRRRLAADAAHRTCSASGRFLTLKAEHLIFHHEYLL